MLSEVDGEKVLDAECIVEETNLMISEATTHRNDEKHNMIPFVLSAFNAEDWTVHPAGNGRRWLRASQRPGQL